MTNKVQLDTVDVMQATILRWVEAGEVRMAGDWRTWRPVRAGKPLDDAEELFINALYVRGLVGIHHTMEVPHQVVLTTLGHEWLMQHDTV